jgi:hypothetical protein
MDSDQLRDWRTWVAAERDGLDDDADAAFRALFAAVPAAQPDESFAVRVAMTSASAARRQALLLRAAVIVGAIVSVALTVALLLQVPRLIQAALDLIVATVVSTSLAFSRGLDAWTVLGGIARAVGSVVVTPQGTVALSGLGLIAIGALYGLHRMLELEERSSL